VGLQAKERIAFLWFSGTRCLLKCRHAHIEGA
jgi:hypothetical protein